MSKIETTLLVVFLVAVLYTGAKVLEQTSQTQTLVYKIINK